MALFFRYRTASRLAALCALAVLLAACGSADQGMGAASGSSDGSMFVSDAGSGAISIFASADPASNVSPMDRTMNTSPNMNMAMNMNMNMGAGMGTMGGMNMSTGMVATVTGADATTCANSCHHNPAAASGSLAADRTVAGTATDLNAPAGIVFDAARDILYVANSGGASILAYDQADTVDGDAAPSRIITNASLRHPGFLSLADDTLYISDADSQAVLVIADASTADGDTAAARIIRGDSANGSRLDAPHGVAADPNTGMVYVANAGGGSVSILRFSPDASGNAPASRVYTTPLASAGGLSFDSTRDMLYVGDPAGDAVAAFAHIGSDASGTLAPSRTIAIAGAQGPSDVFLDLSHDVLFAADGGARTVWVVEDAAEANGTVVALPIRWRGAQGPFGVFVDRS